MHWLAEDGSDVLLEIHLQPGARRTALAGEHGNRLKIAMQAPPVDGRANEALIDWLSTLLGVSRRQLTIDAGLRSRNKIIRIRSVSAADVRRRLVVE
jgi:uncharacterized protein